MNEQTPHWSEDDYWTNALDRFFVLRDSGISTLTLDLRAIESEAFNDNGPAYKLMEAMCSVKESEGGDGFRGAPRVMLALLSILKEITNGKLQSGQGGL